MKKSIVTINLSSKTVQISSCIICTILSFHKFCIHFKSDENFILLHTCHGAASLTNTLTSNAF